jgi:hypothetical protein
MTISAAPGRMTSEEIVRLARAHTFFSWFAQGAIDPDGAFAIIDAALDLADEAVR